MKWISIKDRVPEKNKDIIITDGKIVGTGQLYDDNAADSDAYCALASMCIMGGEYWFQFDEVTHWMPLPEPPKHNQP